LGLHRRAFRLFIPLIHRTILGKPAAPVLARFLREIAGVAVVPSAFTISGPRVDLEGKMLISIWITALASQLVIAVADDVPKFDIERECRVDSASAFDLNAGMNATIKRCVGDEQKAKSELQTQWADFTGSDRVMCISATVGAASDDNVTPPSYVGLLTCLQDQQLARKLPKE
jgi:hypothetical protein